MSKLKNEPNELKELKESINKNKKNKLSRTDEFDKIFLKLQSLYTKISEKLFVKYDLKNELKQGKIFTIIIAILIFIYLIIITVFFLVMLNSLLGLNFIFSILKYSIFFLKWGYKILKNKGNVILKYLTNLFPNSKVLNNKKEIKLDNLPVFESNILEEVKGLIIKLESLNIDISFQKELVIKLKDIVNNLNLHNETFSNEIKSLSYKNEIIKQLIDVKNAVLDIELKQEMENRFMEVKMDVIEELDKVIEDKVYTKVKSLKL